MVKLLNADLERYPNFQNALGQAQQVVLGPGDVLFIPPLWWHCVESFGFNLMINSWYNDSTVAASDTLRRAKNTLHSAIVASSNIELQSSESAEALSLLDTTSSKSSNTTGQNAPLANQPGLRNWLIQAQHELELMPPYWRNWFFLQYSYYVLKTNGDPYPTLPGALEDFVQHERRLRWSRNPILALPGKILRQAKQAIQQLAHR